MLDVVGVRFYQLKIVLRCNQHALHASARYLCHFQLILIRHSQSLQLRWPKAQVAITLLFEHIVNNDNNFNNMLLHLFVIATMTVLMPGY